MAPQEEEVAVDLTDPRQRAAALRAMTTELILGSSYCQDRARVVAARLLDRAVAAAHLEARLAGLPDAG